MTIDAIVISKLQQAIHVIVYVRIDEEAVTSIYYIISGPSPIFLSSVFRSKVTISNNAADLNDFAMSVMHLRGL